MAESDVEIRRVLEQRYSVLNYLVDRPLRGHYCVQFGRGGGDPSQ